MAIVHITPKNFDELVKSEGPVIVDFWAPWCGPCQMLGPLYEELSSDYEGKLAFLKLNTEDHPELTGEFGISGIPAMLVLKNGKEVDRIIGFLPKEMLKQKIDSILATL